MAQQAPTSLLPGLPGNPMPEQGAQPGQDPNVTGEEDSNVSPEEQAQYTEFEENYMRLIYDGEQVRPELLEALEAARDGGEDKMETAVQGNAPSPAVATLAQTAVHIVGRIDDAAAEAQRPISDDVLFHGAVAVIEELAEVAEAAGIYDYSEQEMSGALTVAVDMYREKAIQSGRTDENTLTSEWDRLIAADKEGRADEVAPGIMEAGGQQQ
jgi:cellobiose-specific phosphotransferase system component IIA